MLKSYLLKYKKQLIIGPIFKLIEAVLELLTPIIMIIIIDYGISDGRTDIILTLGAVMLIISALSFLSAVVCQYHAAKASQSIGTDLRNDIFKKSLDLSTSQLDSIGRSSLNNRISVDVNNIQTAVAMFIRLVIRTPLLIIGSCIISSFINLKISIVFILSSIVISIIIYKISKESMQTYLRVQEGLDNLSDIIKSNLLGAKNIRIFNTFKKETEKMQSSDNSINKFAKRAADISSLTSPLTTLTVNISIVLILLIGRNEALSGVRILQGDIIALINYMSQILISLVTAANLTIIFSKAKPSAKRIDEILCIKTTNNNTKYPSHLKNPIGKLELSDITFCYNNSKDIIKNISFKAYKGENIGIIGNSGSGKSTILKLIMNIYTGYNGYIYADGTNLKLLTHGEIKKRISLVPQSCPLFRGSLRENLTLRDPYASDKEIFRVLDIVSMAEFVETAPGKLDYKILQDGRNLSGGQRQRLCIARALIGAPQILLLDNSFSSLDNITAARIENNIKLNFPNIIIINASQKISSVKNCDIIIVIDKGEIIAADSHDKLIKDCKLYNDILQSQS